MTAPTSDSLISGPVMLEEEIQILHLPGANQNTSESFIPVLGKALDKSKLVERLIPLLTKEELIAVLAEKQKIESCTKSIGTSPIRHETDIINVPEFILPTLLEIPAIQTSDISTQMKIPLYKPPSRATSKPLFTTTYSQSIKPEISSLTHDLFTPPMPKSPEVTRDIQPQASSNHLEKSLHMTKQLQERIKQLRQSNTPDVHSNSSVLPSASLIPVNDSNISEPKEVVTESIESSVKVETPKKEVALEIEECPELPCSTVMSPVYVSDRPVEASMNATVETIDTLNASTKQDVVLKSASSFVPSNYRKPKKKTLKQEVSSLNSSLGNLDNQIAQLQLMSENLEREFEQDREMIQNHQVNTIGERLQNLETRSFTMSGHCNSARHIATKIRDELRCLHYRASSPSSTPTKVRFPKLSGSVTKKRQRARNVSKQQKMSKARSLINSIYLES